MSNKAVILVLLSLNALLPGCKKETHKQSIQFYFRGTINGLHKDWTVADYKNGDDLKYRYNVGSGLGTLSNDCVNTFCKYMIEDAEVFQNNGPGPTKNYIAASFYISSKTGDRNEILDQFTSGKKTFGKPRVTIDDPVKDGVYVYYIDENGKEWSSYFGSGDQSESIFEIEELALQPFTEINCMNIWNARFSCDLYDYSGNSIHLDKCELFTPFLLKK